MKNLKNNKWFRAAIPALLLHCSIGTVYCWSIFSKDIARHIGFENSPSATEWAFSLAIFFLGMSAAFLGHVVEKNMRKKIFTNPLSLHQFALQVVWLVQASLSTMVASTQEASLLSQVFMYATV